MGGNVFVLRQSMKHSGFDIFLKEISNDDNYLYIGYSAGSCVLSKRLDIFKNVVNLLIIIIRTKLYMTE